MTSNRVSVNKTDVIAPNFKRRLSGVTATVVRLVPLQARKIAIAATAPIDLPDVPQVSLWSLLTMSRRGPSGVRVWHARRNVEMIAGLALRDLLGKKLKLVFTSASQREHTGMTKSLIRKMDAVVATSQRTADYLERPAKVIHHGIDTEGYSPAPDRAALRRELGLPEDALIMGCYGRIRAQKGTDVFANAMIEVLKARPDAVALVMGRATAKHQEFEDDLKKLVKSEGLEERLRFMPEVPVWQMADWYRVLDLYVAPQRWEGFGLTPLEAMSCGVPALATRVGAFEELIADPETGKLVPADDIPAMTQAALELTADPEHLAQLGTAARKRVLAKFRIEQEADTLIGIYRALLVEG